MCLWLCIASVHNIKQSSSNNLPSYLQTNITAQMLSIRGEGSPDSFNHVVSAVRLECQFVHSDKHQLARLSTPSLQKCAAMLRNAALKARDSDLASSAANYLLVHASEWPQRVSTFALWTINLDRQNKADMLPLTGDIIKLSKYLDVELNKRSGPSHSG